MKRFCIYTMLNVLVVGCASDPELPPPPPPTLVNLQIEASANLNADSNGNGAPVMLRVYELREQSNFSAADFFALYDNEQATLSADLARKQNLLLKPGETKKLTIKPDDDVASVGFFAAFRQLDRARWRAIAEVQPHQTQDYRVKLIDNQLTVEAIQPAASAPQEP